MKPSERTVVNPATGERVTFLRTAAETGGELLVMEDRWPGAEHVVSEHAHPGMEERWEVLEGAVLFRIGGEEKLARAGDRVVAPPGVAHSAQNAGGGPVTLRIEMRPALRWEQFVRRLFASEGDPEAERRLGKHLVEFAEELRLPDHRT